MSLPFGINVHQHGMTRAMPGGSVTHLSPSQGGGGMTDWSTLAAQPANFAGALSNNFGTYGTGLAGMANAYGTIGSAAHGAAGQAEAARQLAAGNIANQALSSYGGMGNAAMSAWAQNQAAYNQSLAGMVNSNQVATSQLGQSRNQALSGLGGPMSQVARGAMVASALGGMAGGGGGGDGFSAQSPSGPLASGSFGGSPSYGGGGGGGGAGAGGMSALRGLQGALMDNTFLNSLTAGSDAGRQQLDAQHYSSRDRPFEFMDQALGGLSQLGRDGYSALGAGMDQFYGNDAGAGALSGIGQAMGSLSGGFQAANEGVRGMWDDTLGQHHFFQSPAEAAQAQRDARMLNERFRLEDRLRASERSASRGGQFAGWSQRNADRLREDLARLGTPRGA